LKLFLKRIIANKIEVGTAQQVAGRNWPWFQHKGTVSILFSVFCRGEEVKFLLGTTAGKQKPKIVNFWFSFFFFCHKTFWYLFQTQP